MTRHLWILLSAPPKNKGIFSYIHSITVRIKKMNHFLVSFQSREFLKNTASWSRNAKLEFKGARTGRPAICILCCWWLPRTQPSTNVRGADRQDGGKSQLWQQLRRAEAPEKIPLRCSGWGQATQAADPVALPRAGDLKEAERQRRLALFRKRQDLMMKAPSP